MTIETATEWIAEARSLQERGERLLPKLSPELQEQARGKLAELEATIAEATEHTHWILPPNWECWGEGERAAWRKLQDAFDATDAARKAVHAALPQPVDHDLWLLVDHLQVCAEGERFVHTDVVRERLRRYLPHLSDLIDYATQTHQSLTIFRTATPDRRESRC